MTPSVGVKIRASYHSPPVGKSLFSQDDVIVGETEGIIFFSLISEVLEPTAKLLFFLEYASGPEEEGDKAFLQESNVVGEGPKLNSDHGSLISGTFEQWSEFSGVV